MSDPTIPIAWKLQDNLFYGIAQGDCFSLLSWLNGNTLLGIVPSTIDLQQLAEMTDGYGLLLLTRVLNHRMPLFKGSLPNAFFSRAFSSASCPQNRSSSAIFASALGGSEEAGA